MFWNTSYININDVCDIVFSLFAGLFMCVCLGSEFTLCACVRACVSVRARA